MQQFDFAADDPANVPIPGAIVDHLARCTTNQGDGEGWGLLEVMNMGPHPQYFTAWDDVAP